MTRQFRIVVKPYKSDNHLGYNAVVQCLEKQGRKSRISGLLYVSFDHGSPRFLWEKAAALSAGNREYLELIAQRESEKAIRELLAASPK